MDRRRVFRTLATYALCVVVVAALGALVGWMAGDAFVGAVIGGTVGFWGCFRAGHALGEPNIPNHP